MKMRMLLAAGLACILMGCKNNVSETMQDNLSDIQKLEDAKQVTDQQSPPGSDPQSNGTGPIHASQQIDWNKKIVKTADLKIEVAAFKSFSDQLPSAVRSWGGYISSEEQSQSGNHIENRVVIRVPVDQFETALNALVKGEVNVLSRQIQSEDVTTQLVDGKARLEARKSVRLRYLDLLGKAKNMEEILRVEQEVNSIQEEIESMGARIEQLTHTSSMSTIRLTYSEKNENAIVPEEGYLAKMKIAFLKGAAWVADLVVGLVVLWPVLIPAILLLIVYRKKFRPLRNPGQPGNDREADRR